MGEFSVAVELEGPLRKFNVDCNSSYMDRFQSESLKLRQAHELGANTASESAKEGKRCVWA